MQETIKKNASPVFGMSDLLKVKHLIHKPLGGKTDRANQNK
jgi:hypothetical protein